jgi:hypothetical protein
MRYRIYIETPEGLRRISTSVLNQNIAVSQFVGRHKCIDVYFGTEHGHTSFTAMGVYMEFDQRGVASVLIERLHEIVELRSTDQQIESQRWTNSKIAVADVFRRRKALTAALSWSLTEAQMKAISDDLNNRRPIPLIRGVRLQQ